MSSAQPERRACGSSPIATVGRSAPFAVRLTAARPGRVERDAAPRLPCGPPGFVSCTSNETRRRRQRPREGFPPSVSDPSATTSARRPGHDPTVVADLAVADEPELLVGRKSTVVENPAGTAPASSGYPSTA